MLIFNGFYFLTKLLPFFAAVHLIIFLISNIDDPIKSNCIPFYLLDYQPRSSTSSLALNFIWLFPKIGVPLNHPFIEGFSMK